MGADIKALRTRIKSVDSTLHLTKAMGLVASSKIRRAMQNMMQSRDYAVAIRDTMDVLSSVNECRKSPYMKKRDTGRTRLIVIAGDRGLAGGYNANVFRFVNNYPDAEIIPIGKRACERYGGEISSSEKYSYEEARALCDKLCKEFADGEYDRLGVVSTEYISMMSQEAKVTWLLPIEENPDVHEPGIIFEPDELTILNEAVPEYLTAMLIAALRESFASEVAARRTAMDSAGKNAQTMIDDLRLQYNRARQGAITQEITEIVAGSGD